VTAEVTVQSWTRNNGRTRYAYTVKREGYGPFQSTFRYKTAKLAQQAGEADVQRTGDFLDTHREKGETSS
jgi:hypothetical protein